MDENLHADPQSNGEEDCLPEGAFFPRSQNFVVSGGTFTSITNNCPRAAAGTSDFRIIPLGDVDLRRQLSVEGTHYLTPRRWKNSVRRVYSAKVVGQEAAVSVAVYEGKAAKQHWQDDISQQLWIRHPNFVQIYGTVESHAGVYATIFYDELIPLNHFVGHYRLQSQARTVYAYACCYKDFEECRQYFAATFERGLWPEDCILTVRQMTRRLCVDPATPERSDSSWPILHDFTVTQFADDLKSHDPSQPEDVIMSALTLGTYHAMLSLHLWRSLAYRAAFAMARPGAIIHEPRRERSGQAAVALIPLQADRIHANNWTPSVLRDRYESPWDVDTADEAMEASLMPNGWTRYSSFMGPDGISIEAMIALEQPAIDSWLSQANDLFGRLNITSNREDYNLVIAISPSIKTGTPQNGYLFVCPLLDFLKDPWPDPPAYWSLDSEGEERLSQQDANRLGFPNIEFTIDESAMSFEDAAYEALGTFHSAKGFDPYSLEVARHLGHPPLEIAGQDHGLAGDENFADGVLNDGDVCEEGTGAATMDGSPSESADECNSGDTEKSIALSRPWYLVMFIQIGLILVLACCLVFDFL
ncbi:hypothetical protein DFH06DRAFT_1216333 [Mycena polygramma]|nr:hypothetical protein DFH06DRAFT_1216333 [Mycena polygramma]